MVAWLLGPPLGGGPSPGSPPPFTPTHQHVGHIQGPAARTSPVGAHSGASARSEPLLLVRLGLMSAMFT